jgi:glycine cleavage system H protein
MSGDYPEELRYSKDHEWLRVGADNKVQVGITKFAADQLGDVVMVELPTEGDTYSAGEMFGTIESVKSVADLFAPVSGKVTKINTPLNDTPEYVNEEPYDEGWMIEIEMTDPSEVEGLMNATAYAELVADSE